MITAKNLEKDLFNFNFPTMKKDFLTVVYILLNLFLLLLLYSSIDGVLPRTEDSTTTGVEANKDSPFLSSESATTRPLKDE